MLAVYSYRRFMPKGRSAGCSTVIAYAHVQCIVLRCENESRRGRCDEWSSRAGHRLSSSLAVARRPAHRYDDQQPSLAVQTQTPPPGAVHHAVSPTPPCQGLSTAAGHSFHVRGRGRSPVVVVGGRRDPNSQRRRRRLSDQANTQAVVGLSDTWVALASRTASCTDARHVTKASCSIANPHLFPVNSPRG